MSGNKETGSLTDAQTKFLASMMQNTKSKPDVDWDAVAAEINITAKSAKERYRLLAIQMGWSKKGDSAADAGPKTPKKPAGGVTKRTGKVGDSGKKKTKVVKQDKNEEAQAEAEAATQNGEV